MRLKEILQEASDNVVSRKLLNESVVDISVDVAKIYRRYMANDLTLLLTNGPSALRPKILHLQTVDKMLESSAAKEAFKKNPLTIVFYERVPMYDANTSTVYLNFDDDLIKHLDEFGSLPEIKQRVSPGKYIHLKQAATQETTEAIISHELSHWIRDSLGSRYIAKAAIKFADRGGLSSKKAIKQWNGGYNDPYLSNTEIDGQVYELLPLYNKYKAHWEELTWNELMYLSTALHKRNQTLSPEDKEIWKKKMKIRMQREGILGKKMRNT